MISKVILSDEDEFDHEKKKSNKLLYFNLKLAVVGKTEDEIEYESSSADDTKAATCINGESN